MSDYIELQQSIDKVIGKIGLQKTKFLLDSFIENTKVTQNESEKIKMVSQYLVTLAIKIFELKDDLFYMCEIREYRDARICCYHLLRKYTQQSFPKIAQFFGRKSRSIMYAYYIAEDRLSMPKGNMRFANSYAQLETKLLEFIGKIN